ncbi:S-layer homology domain-containing protein [Collinsella tanakaei]|uniref:S-layer homology domain-containing protein n=1 Tax=Collinsella tanakaei TaxID=626935 RepID=UPI00345CC2A7
MKTKAVVTAGLCAALTLTGASVALAEGVANNQAVGAAASSVGSVTVSNQSDLRAALENNDVVSITLSGDISFSEEWDPIVIAKGRTLVIDGAGHTISGMKVTKGVLKPNGSGVAGDGGSCNYYCGFIGNSGGNLTIKDLAFNGADVDINPLDVDAKSTGSSIIAVVVANNTGQLVMENVSVENSVTRGYTKVGILHGFTKESGSAEFTKCSMANTTTVLEADGTDSEACFAGTIAGYNGNNRIKTKGIRLSNAKLEVANSVKWGVGTQVKEDGTVFVNAHNDSWGLTTPTYTTDSNGVNTVAMVASVDGYQYETLEEAIAAAEAGSKTKITLLKNVTESVTIPAGKIIALDLNGKKLSATGKDNAIIVDGGQLSVSDSTAANVPVVDVEAGTVNYESGEIVAGEGAAVKVQRGGKLNIVSGKLDSNANCAVFILGNMNPVGSDDETPLASTVNMSGGYVEAQEFALTVQGRGATMNVTGGVAKALDNAVLAGNGTNSADKYCGGTVMNVSGGEFIGNISSAGYIACGVYHPQVGELNISGTAKFYVNNGVGVLMRGGTLKMTGGTVETTGTASGKVGDSSVIANCYGIYVDGSANYYGSKLDGFGAAVSNGTVKTQADVPALNLSEGKDTKGAIKATGGSFSSNPKDFVEEGYDIEESNGVFNVSKHQDPIPPVTPPTSSDKTEVEHNQDGSTTTTVTKPDGSQTITHETATGTESVVKKDSEGNVTSTEVSVSKDDAASGKVELPIGKAEPAADADKAHAVEVKVPSTVTPDKPVQVTVPVAKAEGAEPDYGIVVYAVDADGNETVIPKCAVDEDGNVTFEAAGNVTIKVVDNAKDMPDVTDADWFAGDVVDFATARGIVNGVDMPDGSKEFQGYGGTSRGMLVAMLHNLELNPEAAGDATLPDVPAGAFYADAAAWALGEGILSGVDMPDGTKQFQGDAPVTREQVAVFLMRYAEALGMDTSRRAEVGFPDASEVSAFAKDAMSWAVAEGLFKGNDATGELNPTDGAARAEVAAVLMRFIKLMYA